MKTSGVLQMASAVRLGDGAGSPAVAGAVAEVGRASETFREVAFSQVGEIAMSYRSLLAHLTLALSLVVLLVALHSGLDVWVPSASGLLPVLLVAGGVVPVAVVAASRVGPLSMPGSLAAAIASAVAVWLGVLWVLWSIGRPADPEASLLQFAAYTGAGPVLRLGLLLGAATVGWVWLLRRYSRSD